MNFKHSLLILLIMGILLFSLSAANANDMNDTQIIKDDDDSNQNSIYASNDGNDEDNGETWNNPVQSISNALNKSKNKTDIYLDNGTYAGNKNTKIIINKSVNFIGSNNTIIDGENKNYLFQITDNVQVTFTNIIFINAYKNTTKTNVYGGALEINNAQIKIENCQFISNTIDDGTLYGGAISNFGNLEISNSYFYQNSIKSDHNKYGFGGSIYNNGNLTIINSSFIESNGGEYSNGAVIYNDGIATIDNSIFKNNYAKEESKGSVIFNNGELTLTNSLIENNTIERYNFNFIYGSIFNSGKLVAFGNIFKNNTAYYKQPNSGYEGSPTIFNDGDLNLNYNAFIGNIGGFEKIYTDLYISSGRAINIDNNWWGNNDNPFNTKNVNMDLANTWLLINVTPIYSSININESVDIITSWTLSNGTEPQHLLPMNVTYTDYLNQIQTRNLADDGCVFTFNKTQNKGIYEIRISVESFTKTVEVDVGKINSYLRVNTTDNVYPNDILEIDINLFDENSIPLDGNVLVTINNQVRTIYVINGQGNCSFTNLIPGDYELKVIYNGTDNYFKSFNQTHITINKYPIELTSNSTKEVFVNENPNINVNLATEEVEGEANLYINGEFKQIIYLAYGSNIVSFSNFKQGTYNITIEVLGNDYYNKTQVTTILNVIKYDSIFNITTNNAFIDENVTLKITSTDNFRGEVILSINGVNNTLFLKDKITNITLSNLSEGVYYVDLIFNGNDLFNPQNTTTSFKVLKYPSTLTVTINDTKIDVSLNPNSCTGFVDVYINFKHYKSNLTNGKTSFDVEFDEGSNYIYIFYSGDDHFENSNWNTTFGEGEAYALIGEDITFYEYNNFNYTVQLFEKNGMAMPNKVISINLDSEEYNITTNSQGIAILPLNLKIGNYTVTSTHNNITTTNHLIIKAIEFNLETTNTTYGEQVNITVEFDNNITGKVNLTIQDSLSEVLDIIDGRMIYTIDNLKCGDYEVNAFYTNDLFNSSTQKSQFTVDKLNSTLYLNISEAMAGEDEIITVTGDNLTGNIVFTIDDTQYPMEMVNSEAQVVLSGLSGGIHSLNINYLGDEYHKNTSLSQNFSIKILETDLIISINDTAYGEYVNVTVKVKNNATGNILFTVNDLKGVSQIEDGIASWSFTGFNVGTYELTANYLGDAYFISSINSTQFNITKANSKIELYTTGVYLDENIRIYARLSPNATGKVSFRMEDYYSPRDKDIINATSTWLIAPLETGQYRVYATYYGDSNYYSSTTTFILNVSQKRSILTVEANDVNNRDNVTIKATLLSINNEKINGVVKIQIGTTFYEININDGHGMINIGRLEPGDYVLKAEYDGNNNFSNASVISSLKVYDSLIKSILTCDDVIKYYNNNKKFIITLTNGENKPIYGEIIHVSIKGVETIHITDEYGKIYLDISNTLEKYEVTAWFKGSATYSPSSTKGTIEILPTIEANDVAKIYGSAIQYFATFKDLNGKALSNTKITLNIAGKIYNYVTFPNGVIRLNINLSPGTYKIIAINPVTGERKINTLTIYNRLRENKDVANYFGEKSTYKVRVYDSNTKAVGAGKIVTFKVNGKTYKIKTDKNGYATLSIKLNANQHIITAEYYGLKVYNKITVKPVLTTKIKPNNKTKKTKFIAKLVDTKGKAIKGKKITFKINGKKYRAKTNKKGIAVINIKLKLKKGIHNIYTIYGQSKILNKIRIL